MLQATPFHARAAEANRDNAWVVRNGTTLAARFAGADGEALTARLNVVVADISWRWRVALEGASVERFLARLITRDPATLVPGTAFKALWLTDKGGVRGAGVVSRWGQQTFLIAASAPDAAWIAAAAALYGVACRDVVREAGGLAVVGPYAQATLNAAGLDSTLAPLAFRKLSWLGVEITLSRWGEHGGYEIWCAPDDGVLVWDRLMRAGEPFGIVPAGADAMDILDLEAGVARPWLDYDPATTADGGEPKPAAVGLDLLVDEAHAAFNGRAAWRSGAGFQKLVGLELDSATPAPFTPVFLDGTAVGRTLRSCYSPSLRRAIALATLDAPQALPEKGLWLTLPASRAVPELRRASVRVARLPFLEAPAQIVP